MIILGNKADLKERVIKREEAKQFFRDRNLPYFETSTRTMQNINEAFEKMVELILESQNINNLERNESRLRLNDYRRSVPKKGCCI